MSKKVGNKTRRFKGNVYKYNIENIVIMFLRMLNTVKLFHWRTFSYPEHKATDELYGNLNSNIDTFVETMLGKTGGRVNLTKQKTLPLLAIENINDFKISFPQILNNCFKNERKLIFRVRKINLNKFYLKKKRI